MCNVLTNLGDFHTQIFYIHLDAVQTIWDVQNKYYIYLLELLKNSNEVCTTSKCVCYLCPKKQGKHYLLVVVVVNG